MPASVSTVVVSTLGFLGRAVLPDLVGSDELDVLEAESASPAESLVGVGVLLVEAAVLCGCVQCQYIFRILSKNPLAFKTPTSLYHPPPQPQSLVPSWRWS